MIYVVISMLSLIYFLSIPMISEIFEKSLYLDSPVSQLRPDVIVVLAGGYKIGFSLDQDVMGAETILRIITGIKLWKRYPDAIIVMSGVEMTK